MGNMCCNPSGPAPVIVHIYDVTGSAPVQYVNEVLRPMGTGAFHAAVEVHGKEWSFGQCKRGGGIFSCAPTCCELHSYREAIHMGHTDLTESEVESVIMEMQKRWRGKDYDVLRKNCCHFSDELCQLLGVGTLPSWVTSMAGTFSLVEPSLRDLRARLMNPFCLGGREKEKEREKEETQRILQARLQDQSLLGSLP
ncbi:unnamed protein product [Effrenium voratum]|uniref:PPPDE domain-containing protein n=1 Tax=Effrenium voratum TaxID=2562239 RepID=A0AA36J5A9_9DINO|nr:unnamed protein product [Effrenium voratum]CAJ1416007.1 unnamed protein product [Effrenium voratum]